MIKNIKAITASCYVSMFFLGVSASVVGAAARNIGLSPYQIGLLLAAQNIGFMASVFLSGTLSDSYDKPRILMIGSLILSAGLLAFYRTQLLWVNMVVILLIGAGMATYEGVTDPLLVDSHGERATFHININHFFVNFGAAMMPLYMVFLREDWQRAVAQAGFAVLVIAAVFGATRVKAARKRAASYAERFRILVRERVLLLLALAMVAAAGVELGTMGILTTYLMELRGFSQVTSKIGLVVFFLGMAVGRIVAGFLTRKGGIVRYTLGFLGVCIFAFAALYFVDVGRFTYVTIALAGLALSAPLPLMLALAGLLYPNIAGTAMAALKLSAGLGGVIVPFLMSLVTKAASLEVALAVFPAVCLAGFMTLLVAARRIRPAAPAEGSGPQPEAR